MKRVHRLLAVGLAAGVLFGSAGAASASARDDQDRVTVYGLTTSQRIISFDLDNPQAVRDSVGVKGLASGERVIGFDRRPANDTFYAVATSRSGATLYTIDPTTGRTSRVAALVSAPTVANPARTPVALNGNEFGVDFNPAADALRIVSDSGQNLRVIPSARTAPDGTALLTGDTFTDGALNRGAGTATVVGVSGAAYTNNDTDPATATVLYDIDSQRDELSIQNPPNAGTLTNTVPLGQETGPRVGFDIRTTADGDLAVASLTRRVGSTIRTRIVTVDLAAGAVDSQGQLRRFTLRDIALAK